ncbi:MAG: hypothetical protein HWE11_09020 [Gammaproteobacteria bacterium]|nr:hypothetical protein [Gammaproteobacteria bacterium]
MKKIFLVLVCIVVSACSVRYPMHSKQGLTDNDVGLIFDPRAYLTIYSIDGKRTDYTMAKVVELEPGKHRFVLTWNTSFRPPVLVAAPLFQPDMKDPYVDLEVEIKKGYSYTISAIIDGKPVLDGPAKEACIFGEPTNAPGSSVNVTGEYRIHSEKVQKIGCAPINFPDS